MTRLAAAVAALVVLTSCAPASRGAPRCHEARAAGISLPERFISHDDATDLHGPWPAFERPCTLGDTP